LTAGEFAANFAAFAGSKRAMNRDTLITAMLVIAGIVLAFVLFGAGVRWKSKRPAEPPSASTTAATEQCRSEFLKGTDIRHVTST
jgi:hypothetical protein